MPFRRSPANLYSAKTALAVFRQRRAVVSVGEDLVDHCQACALEMAKRRILRQLLTLVLAVLTHNFL